MKMTNDTKKNELKMMAIYLVVMAKKYVDVITDEEDAIWELEQRDIDITEFEDVDPCYLATYELVNDYAVDCIYSDTGLDSSEYFEELADAVYSVDHDAPVPAVMFELGAKLYDKYVEELVAELEEECEEAA